MGTRQPQTEIAVLGALSVQPMTGYRVRELIREVLGHFWSESYGQIYPTLGRLEDEGFVRRLEAARTGASTFEITSSGMDRLRERLQEPAAMAPPRNGLLLRLFFGRHLGVDGCRDLLRTYRNEVAGVLAGYAQIREGLGAEAGSEDQPFWLLTLSAGEHHVRAAIAWADESLESLDRIERGERGTHDG